MVTKLNVIDGYFATPAFDHSAKLRRVRTLAPVTLIPAGAVRPGPVEGMTPAAIDGVQGLSGVRPWRPPV